MAKSPLTIAALMGFILVCSSVFAESSPFIVAHKRVSHKKLNQGVERITVSIDIYNEGFGTAYDVTLTDDTWAQEVFDSVIGNTSKTWEKLDVGSIVSHSFELESSKKTVYFGASALITYRIPLSTKLQEAYSTPILPLKILAESTSENKFDLAKRLLAKYGSHVSVLLLVVLFVQLISNPSKPSGNKKKH